MQIDFDRAWRQTQILVNDIVKSLPNLVLAILVLILFMIAGRYASRLTRVLVTRAHQAPGVGILLGRLVTYFAVILGVLVALSVVFPTFKASDLIQVLGIGGIAVGFAFKDIFQNFLAGILLLISKPFRIGDQIVVKDMEGTVEDIQTRATTVRTYDNRRIVIPNITMYTEDVTVLTAYNKRRTDFDFGIDAKEDVDRVKAVILQVLAEIEEVEEDPAPDVLVWSLGEASVTLRIRWWTSAPWAKTLSARDKVFGNLKKAFEAENIDMPLPTQVVVLQENERTSEKEDPAA